MTKIAEPKASTQRPDINLEDLLRNPPKLHRDSLGTLTSWQLDESALRFISRNVKDTSKTMETGAGTSTILFALRGACHICIVPDADQVNRVEEYCAEHHISTAGVNFIVDRSEIALPLLEVGEIDLVLIDGRHAFPTPFIDWYYSSLCLKVGGLLMIDDIQLWSGKVLRKFLLSEPEWHLHTDLPRTSVFLKLREGSHNKAWPEQAYLVRRSRSGILSEQFRFGFRLLREGKFVTLISGVKKLKK